MTTAFRTNEDNLSGAISFRGVDNVKLVTTGPELLGTPKAPTAAAGNNTTQVATTAFVTAAIQAVNAGSAIPSNVPPQMDGAAAAGSSTTYSRGDHVHPSDTSRAPLTSPTFLGVPAAPTAAPNTNTTQLATTAFVTAATSGPKFRAKPSAPQTGIPASVSSKIFFTDETFDTANCFSNSRFTPNKAGYYQINAMVAVKLPADSAVVTNSTALIFLYKNGAEYQRGDRQMTSVPAASVNYVYLSFGDVVYLNGTSDYIEIYAYQQDTYGTTWSTEGSFSYFSGAYVGS